MQEREDECDAVFEGDYTVLPYDMLFEFLPNCKPNGVTCDADMMWMANALLAEHRFHVVSSKTLQDFPLLRVPVEREEPLAEMSTEALWDVLRMLAWSMDGNLFCLVERTGAWFEQMEELVAHVEARAQHLAANTLTTEQHDMPEYVYRDEEDETPCPLGGESDDETEDLVLTAEINAERKLRTRVNHAFLWDFNSFLSHLKIQLYAAKRLNLVPAPPVRLKSARSRIIAEIKEPTLHEQLFKFRDVHEYERIVSMADKRYYHRHFPTRRFPPARAILACKGVRFVHSDMNPHAHRPSSFVDMFKRKRGGRKVYRLNCDAAFCFVNATQEVDVVRRLLLEDWEMSHPPLNGPRIIYVRALLCWGVVFQWPTVIKCTSLLHAYHVLLKECELRGIPADIPVEKRHAALPRKRIKLELPQSSLPRT